MSILKFVKTKICPICGCGLIVSEEVEQDNFNKYNYREHCSGGRWETRRFACGYKVEYTPNFRDDEVKGQCENDIKRLEKIKKGLKAKKQMDEFIENLDVSNDDKERIKNRVSFSKECGVWW